MIPKPQSAPAMFSWWRDDIRRITQAIRLEEPICKRDGKDPGENYLGRRERPYDTLDRCINVMIYRAM